MKNIKRYRFYLGFFGVVLLVYVAWYLAVWPGPIGPDGYSLIYYINSGIPRNTGKDAAWLLYAMATYLPTSRLEAVVIPVILLHVLILSRILGWVYGAGYRRLALFLLIFIACTPHVLNLASSLYADSIFALAFVGVLFEIWLSLKNGRVSVFSIVILAILIPVAALFKGHGVLIFLPLIYLIYRVKGVVRWLLFLTCVFWVLVVQVGGKQLDLGRGHGALMPLVLFETVNFMQTKPMGLWQNRHMVTDQTREIVHRYVSQEDIDELFDRDYWDTLWHSNSERVKFRSMSKQDRRDLRVEFFSYNIWRNMPAFVSSRVNVFLAAALAQGGVLFPDDSSKTIAALSDETVSRYNAFGLRLLPSFGQWVFQKSYDLRFLLWSPFLGIFLIFRCFLGAVKERDFDEICVTLTLMIQLLGVFMFSVAAEYRYLLIFFFSPLLLFPILLEQKIDRGSPSLTSSSKCVV